MLSDTEFECDEDYCLLDYFNDVNELQLNQSDNENLTQLLSPESIMESSGCNRSTTISTSSSNDDSQHSNNTDFLLCHETLDRASPELWPEKIPGVSKCAASTKFEKENKKPEWLQSDPDDLCKISDLSELSPIEIRSYIEQLNDHAYQLSFEEQREMDRATLLDIFDFRSLNAQNSNQHQQTRDD